MPRRVAEAVADYAREATTGDQEKFVYPAILEQGRKLGAQLLNCQPDEVAFVGPTSLALSFIASGLKLRRGDNILIYFEDYPSNVYPWMALAEQGVEVRLMNTRGLGVIRPKDVMGQVDENTRLVALASCHFISGYRIDYQAIGKYLRERSILFCLDAIQTLGAFPTTVEAVDMLAADAHKWLLGPCGAGVMYVRRAVQDEDQPADLRLAQRALPEFVAQEQIVLRTGVAEISKPARTTCWASSGWWRRWNCSLELGVDNIARELLRKRAWLVPALQAKGYTVLHADAPAETAAASCRSSGPGQTWPRCTRNCWMRDGHFVAGGPGGAELHPAIPALLQHRCGAGASAGGGYMSCLVTSLHELNGLHGDAGSM